jgi:hypoxanthine-DNA glycosylase
MLPLYMRRSQLTKYQVQLYQTMRSTGLPPIIDDLSRVIILGSMPSEMSLILHQYYGNPRNHFWKIGYSLFGREPHPVYEDRVAFLREKRIALWDVIDSCERGRGAWTAR